MKRKILSALLAVMLLCALVFPAAADTVFTTDGKWIIDMAGILDKSEEKELNATLDKICKAYDVNILIVTTEDMQGMEIEEYGPWLYNTALQYNLENTKNVALLTVSFNPRMYDIYCDGLPSEALDLDSIMDDMEADMRSGSYTTAFETYANQCDYYINGHLNGFPFDFEGALLIAVVLGLIIGLISVLVMKSKLKSVRKQNYAHVYVRPNSMRVTVHNDLFLYRTVSRIRKQTNNSSGGSGGSGSPRNAGGRSF